VSRGAAPARIMATAYGDYRFLCPALTDAAAVARFVPQTWSYLFARDNPPTFVPGHDPSIYPGPIDSRVGPWGAFHSSDLQYWFDPGIGRVRRLIAR
jgi:carboxylesterase type B